MRSISADNGISRRTALTRLGASALGLAFMNSSRFAPETKDETLRLRLPKVSERSRALLSQVLEDPKFSCRIPATTVEALAIVMPADRLLSPNDRARHFPARRRAAASSALVGLGGFSSSLSIRAESRSDKLIRSARSTTSRATGRAVRMMKLVRSSRSQAAAVVSKRFSSLVVRSSMRSSRVAGFVAMGSLRARRV